MRMASAGHRCALLSDDAHAPRALGDWRTSVRRGERAYLTQATNLGRASAPSLPAVDGVFYLTAMDRDAEKERLPLNAPIQRAAAHGGGARRRDRLCSVPPRESRRHRRPNRRSSSVLWATGTRPPTRLASGALSARAGPCFVSTAARDHHIVGRPPTGHQRQARAARRQGRAVQCDHRDALRLGGRSPPARKPALACGIDSLGYLSDVELQAEASRWRLMLVPIFATTGANTKLLRGLQLGLPTWQTAAAMPFDLVSNANSTAMPPPPSAPRRSSSPSVPPPSFPTLMPPRGSPPMAARTCSGSQAAGADGRCARLVGVGRRPSPSVMRIITKGRRFRGGGGGSRSGGDGSRWRWCYGRGDTARLWARCEAVAAATHRHHHCQHVRAGLRVAGLYGKSRPCGVLSAGNAPFYVRTARWKQWQCVGK